MKNEVQKLEAVFDNEDGFQLSSDQLEFLELTEESQFFGGLDADLYGRTSSLQAF